MPDVPAWLKKGAIVNVQYWVGHVDDVAVSDTCIMVLVRSTKGIWRNHPAEWLEFRQEHIRPATRQELLDDTRIHRAAVAKMLADIDLADKEFAAKLNMQLVVRFSDDEIAALRTAWDGLREKRSSGNGDAGGEHYKLVALLQGMGVRATFESSSQIENYVEYVIAHGEAPTIY